MIFIGHIDDFVGAQKPWQPAAGADGELHESRIHKIEHGISTTAKKTGHAIGTGAKAVGHKVVYAGTRAKHELVPLSSERQTARKSLREDDVATEAQHTAPRDAARALVQWAMASPSLDLDSGVVHKAADGAYRAEFAGVSAPEYAALLRKAQQIASAHSGMKIGKALRDGVAKVAFGVVPQSAGFNARAGLSTASGMTLGFAVGGPVGAMVGGCIGALVGFVGDTTGDIEPLNEVAKREAVTEMQRIGIRAEAKHDLEVPSLALPLLPEIDSNAAYRAVRSSLKRNPGVRAWTTRSARRYVFLQGSRADRDLPGSLGPWTEVHK